VTKPEETTKDSFGQAMADAVGSLQSLQTKADAAAASYVSGGDTELHDLMITTEELNLGFQLTLQVRNKMLEAYQEIMRMQV
jgi:flagellar hook-basal body complex protein FliE